MVDYKLGLSPGANVLFWVFGGEAWFRANIEPEIGIIVGLVLVLLALMSMLVSTALFFRRSRLDSKQRRSQEKPESVPSPEQLHSPDIETTKQVVRGYDLEESIPSPYREPYSHTEIPTNSASTLNVIVSPSMPRVFRVGIESGPPIGVEVRVTPPTPSPTISSRGSEKSIPGHDSLWWFV